MSTPGKIPADEVDLARWSAGTVMLCADDFAMTEGVSRGIVELAETGHISATSALVTTPHWRSHARNLALLGPRILPGLHINLTLGRPLGAMPQLAPDGALPPVGKLIRASLTARLPLGEIEAEIARQIARFSSEMGHLPRFIDGHQHVHALPQVRVAFFRALACFRDQPGWPAIWLRDPADRLGPIIARGVAVPKALMVAALSRGFAADVEAAGLSTNVGFAGFSDFDVRKPYGAELARCFAQAGPRHLIMCHPGYPDAELALLDPVTGRRRQELEVLREEAGGHRARIWRPAVPANRQGAP